MIVAGQKVKFRETGIGPATWFDVCTGTARLIGERSEHGSLVTIEFGDRMTAVRWEDELLYPKWTGDCQLHKDFMAHKSREGSKK